MISCKLCENNQLDDSKFCMNCGTSFNNNSKERIAERIAIKWENYKEREKEKLRKQFEPLFEEILDIIEDDKELVDYKVEKVKKETVDGSPGHFVRINFHSKNSSLISIRKF